MITLGDEIKSTGQHDIVCYVFQSTSLFQIPDNIATCLPQTDINHRNDNHTRNRYLVRLALSHVSGINMREILFDTTNPKPRFVNKQNFDFNISHTKDNLAIVIAKKGLCGVDLEHERQVGTMHKIANRFMMPEAASSNNVEFVRYWTRLEATVKCMGQGMLSHAKYYDIAADNVLYKNETTSIKVKSFCHENMYISVAHNSQFEDVQIYRYDFRRPTWQEATI